MSAAPSPVENQTRPIGLLQPPSTEAAAVLRQLTSRRWAEAGRSIDALAETPIPHRVWKLLLGGLVLGEQGRLDEAEHRLGHAAALAWVAMSGDKFGHEEAERLAAHALHQLGVIQRRRERTAEAAQTHQAALRLRQRSGSLEEVWESQISLGLDAAMVREYESAIEWHQCAVETAREGGSALLAQQAAAWTHLVNTYLSLGRRELAVDAARAARDLFAGHDAGAAAVAQADLRLGSALVNLAAERLASDAEDARRALDEAMERLPAAQQALEAFGKEHRAEVRCCAEQLDFAERLLASLAGDEEFHHQDTNTQIHQKRKSEG